VIGAAAMSRRARGAAAVWLAIACAPAVRAETANRIVATVDGEPITALEVERYARDRNAEQQPAGTVLQALITDKLLEREIKTLGITARDDDIDRYIREIRERNGMDEAAFERALTAQGLSLEVYRARVKAEIERAQLVNREIRQRVNVTPEEVRRYYDSHLDDYVVAERVKVRDILFVIDRGDGDQALAHTQAKAAEVREMARNGRDFGELARQFSEGPGADKGGELGSFGRGEMDHAIDEVVFTLKPGEVSEIVRTDSGFHILRVDERVAAGHRPFDEVKDEIRQTLYNQALEDRFQNWLSRDLREKHHVEVLN